MKQLHTSSDVIDALGGTSATARRLGCDPRVVSNWRKSRLPARTYPIIKSALEEVGEFDAPDTLWAIMQPSQGADL